MSEGGEGGRQGLCMCSLSRSSGVSREVIKREMETLKETEQQLRKNVGRLFRRRRGFSFQRIVEFFKPDKMEGRGRLSRRWTLKTPRRLFSTGDPQPSIPEHEPSQLTESPHHRRTQTVAAIRHTRTHSDITEHQKVLREEESSSPSLTPSGLHY